MFEGSASSQIVFTVCLLIALAACGAVYTAWWPLYWYITSFQVHPSFRTSLQQQAALNSSNFLPSSADSTEHVIQAGTAVTQSTAPAVPAVSQHEPAGDGDGAHAASAATSTSSEPHESTAQNNDSTQHGVASDASYRHRQPVQVADADLHGDAYLLQTCDPIQWDQVAACAISSCPLQEQCLPTCSIPEHFDVHASGGTQFLIDSECVNKLALNDPLK